MAPVPPAARLASLLAVVAGTFIIDRVLPLSAGIAVLILLTARAGLLNRYLRFLLLIQLPMMIMLILVWGFVTRAPPNMPMGSDPRGGIMFALIIALRLAVVGGAFQLAMLSIPSRLLPETLRGWGLRGEGLVVALGVFAVEPELKLRAEQILIARRARGLLGGSRWAGLKQFPRLLRPLFVWSIRSAVHRAEIWENRTMLLRVERLPSEATPFSSAAGAIAVALSFLWLAGAITLRFLPGMAGQR
jgi:energy-coupling factor transporter transmembrane protein EcfT